jgi:hypothetical protein
MQLNSEQNVPSAHQQAIEAPSTGESPTDQIAHPPEWLGFVAGDSAAEASILSGIVIHGNVGEAKNGTAEQTGAIDAASPILEVPAVEESTLVGLLDAVIPIDVSGLSAAVMDVLSQLNAVYAAKLSPHPSPFRVHFPWNRPDGPRPRRATGRPARRVAARRRCRRDCRVSGVRAVLAYGRAPAVVRRAAGEV